MASAPRLLAILGTTFGAAAVAAAGIAVTLGFRSDHEPACQGIACNLGPSLADAYAATAWMWGAAVAAVVAGACWLGAVWLRRRNVPGAPSADANRAVPPVIQGET